MASKYRFDLSLFSRFRTEIMGISTIAILLCHASGRGVVLPYILEWLFGFGNIGVDIFLLLSGLSMFYSLNKADRPTLGGWYTKRLVRIVLPYAIISTPVWIYYCIINGKGILDFLYYVSTVSFWAEHFGAWYIALLIPLYILTPLIGMIIDRSSYRWISVSVIVAAFVFAGWVSIPGTGTLLNDAVYNIQFVICRVPCFIVGYGIAPAVKQGKGIPWVILPVLLIVYFVCGRVPILRDVNMNLLLAFPAMMLFSFIFEKIAVLRGVFGWFGMISLESYLTNVYLGYLFGTFSYEIESTNINKGNYLSYACVIVFGIIIAFWVHKLDEKILKKKQVAWMAYHIRKVGVGNSFLRKFQSLGALGYLNWLPDKIYVKILFQIRMGKKLVLKAPQTFNEKLQWLKLYDRKPVYALMVDKYEAKKYVADRIGEEYIIPTLGVWERFDDIDIETLPNKFVIKCTHDSGGLVICRDKSKLDKKKVKEKIEKCLKTNYFWSAREWPYKNVQPRIIAEKFMSDHEDGCGLTDYKFYCFDGEPKFLYISEGLENHATAHISFLTLDWKFAPYERSDYKPFEKIPQKPKGYDKMLELCRVLAKDILFLRVDLYQIGEEVYFSELTFSPCSGFIPFKNSNHDTVIGNMLTLPQIGKRENKNAN